jgi:DNA-directed RNA polymerase specialized sigma24 family protein
MTPPVSPDSDEAVLVAALRGGNRDLGKLDARFRRPLLGLARRWVPALDPLLLEDVVQEVWVAISAQLIKGELSYNPACGRAIDFLAAFVPNAAQAVRSRLRPAGERSRMVRKSNDLESLAAECRWTKTDRSSLVDAVDNVAAADEIERVDAKIDIELLAARAEPQVARAIAVMVVDGETMSAAAERVGLSASTFSRRLSDLGRRAA